MKKCSLLILFGCALLMMPQSGFAKTFCFVGVSGGNVYFELSSGKADVKPFGGQIVIEGQGCRAGLWAAVTTDNLGIQWVTTNNSHDPTAGCGNVQTYGFGNIANGFEISYDNEQDGTIEGSFIISPINCNQVPSPVSQESAAAKRTDYSFGGLSKEAE
jgi:hypothetical protein